jgi:hypothetical protein
MTLFSCREKDMTTIDETIASNGLGWPLHHSTLFTFSFVHFAIILPAITLPSLCLQSDGKVKKMKK